MTSGEFLDHVDLVAGLQVPASISTRSLGTGRESWVALLHECNDGFGWVTPEICREQLRKKFL